jgi:uncharacterized membrane protein YkoI
MLQRNALIGASALTAFVLTVIGGVAAGTALGAAAPAPTAAATMAAPTEVPTPVDPLADPAVQQALQAREAQYQELIAQANAQLEQAYQKQQELAKAQAQAAAVAAQYAAAARAAQAQAAVAAAPASANYPVAPDIAAAIALNNAPGAVLLATPELVDFQGVVAYEVRLDRGLVYVDANNGQVLYNGANVPAPSSGGGGGGGGGEQEHDSPEHESGG